ncbi:hypothetical protein RUND412_002988 [Rhizina undulata]
MAAPYPGGTVHEPINQSMEAPNTAMIPHHGDTGISAAENDAATSLIALSNAVEKFPMMPPFIPVAVCSSRDEVSALLTGVHFHIFRPYSIMQIQPIFYLYELDTLKINYAAYVEAPIDFMIGHTAFETYLPEGLVALHRMPRENRELYAYRVQAIWKLKTPIVLHETLDNAWIFRKTNRWGYMRNEVWYGVGADRVMKRDTARYQVPVPRMADWSPGPMGGRYVG